MRCDIRIIALMRACGRTSEQIGQYFEVYPDHIRGYWFAKLNKMTPQEIEDMFSQNETTNNHQDTRM